MGIGKRKGTTKEFLINPDQLLCEKAIPVKYNYAPAADFRTNKLSTFAF
jgi:hypothetical protein